MRWQCIAPQALAFALPLAAAAAETHQHDHTQTAESAVREPEVALREPRTPIPVLTDADRQAAILPSMSHSAGDDTIHSYTLFNRLESWDADSGIGMQWEGLGWIGRDINRLWWRTEGDVVDGTTEAAQVEAFYGHSFSTWWDWLLGARQDFRPGGDRTFAAIGVQGLAPQRFELSVMGYVGTGSQTAARLEAEYELLITNRLILQPLLEAVLYGKSDPERGIGSGLNTLEAGLRLRYEFTRRFAPYAGLVYSQAFGETADLRRAASEDVEEFRVVAGLRIWF